MDVLMPQLGETVAEGKIIKWFKALGEAVARGDNLCEIETDKVTVEVPAISSGVLTEINAEVGTVAPVGMVIAVVSDASAASAAPAASKSAKVAVTPMHSIQAPIQIPPASRAMEVALAAPRTRQLDPFREVDTPRRNFGPAKFGNGIAITPLARRLAADASIDPSQ